MTNILSLKDGNVETSNIIAWLVAGGSFIINLIDIVLRARRDRPAIKKDEIEAVRVKAEAEQTNVETALSLLEPLKKRISDLEIELQSMCDELAKIESLLDQKDEEIKALTKERDDLLIEVDKLRKQVAELSDELKRYLQSKE